MNNGKIVPEYGRIDKRKVESLQNSYARVRFPLRPQILVDICLCIIVTDKLKIKVKALICLPKTSLV